MRFAHFFNLLFLFFKSFFLLFTRQPTRQPSDNHTIVIKSVILQASWQCHCSVCHWSENSSCVSSLLLWILRSHPFTWFIFHYFSQRLFFLFPFFHQVLHAILILALSTMYDINKEKHQRGANILNNILVGITIVTVVINVIISAFDIRDTGYHVHAILNATKPV